MTETAIKKTVRVFFALWPQHEERGALAMWQAPLQQLCGGRLTPVDNLHNTLVFLGEVELERMEALQLAAQEVNGAVFKIDFDLTRYWGHNHIVFAAPGSEPPELVKLVSDLQQRLLHHNFKFDRRGYKPHVTLLRHAHWSDSPLPAMSPVIWKVRDFALVQSVSIGAGMRYEVLARFPLTE